MELVVLDTYDNKTDRERILSMFAENEPEFSLCNNYIKIKKKTAIQTIGYFVLFFCMICYIIYQLNKYFDSDTNRNEYIDITSIDTIPIPFIYIHYADWDLGRDNVLNRPELETNCDIEILKSNNTGNFTYSQLLLDTSLYIDWTFDELFDYIDNDDNNNCQSRYILHNLTEEEGIYHIPQLLFIPSSCDTLNVGTEDYIRFFLSCKSPPFGSLYYQVSDNRNQLRKYNTVFDALNHDGLETEVDARQMDYLISFIYDWYTFNNKIDTNHIYYDYFEINTDFIYQITDDIKELIYNISNTYGGFEITPNNIGIKKTFVTEKSIDLLDIFGLAGGMYSSLSQIFTYIIMFLIWGKTFGKFKFLGISHESGPAGLQRQQLESFLKHRDNKIVELSDEINELKELVNKNICNGNGNNNNNNNENCTNNDVFDEDGEDVKMDNENENGDLINKDSSDTDSVSGKATNIVYVNN